MKAIKVYIATAIDNKILAEITSLYLKSYQFNDINIEITSRWHSMEAIENLACRAEMDFLDIDKSDILLAIYPYGESGTISEMAYAYGKRIPVIYLRDKQFHEYDPLIVGLFFCNPAFYSYPDSIIVETIKDLLFYLPNMVNKPLADWTHGKTRQLVGRIFRPYPKD